MKITIEDKKGFVGFRINEEYASKLFEIQKKLKVNKSIAIKKGIDMLYESMKKSK